MKHLLEENLKNVNKTNSIHHQHLYFRHSQHVGRTQTSCLLRQFLVNYPTIVEKVLKFLAFRQRQNIFPRLKGHNQNCISWRDIFNMLKSLRRSDLVSSALHKKLSFPLSISSLNLYHSKNFQVFTMRMDFCSNWRNQTNISSESTSIASYVMVGIRKKGCNLEFWFYMKPKQ